MLIEILNLKSSSSSRFLELLSREHQLVLPESESESESADSRIIRALIRDIWGWVSQ